MIHIDEEGKLVAIGGGMADLGAHASFLLAAMSLMVLDSGADGKAKAGTLKAALLSVIVAYLDAMSDEPLVMKTAGELFYKIGKEYKEAVTKGCTSRMS